MATCISSLTTFLAISLLITLSSSTKPLTISTTSKDQIACTVCESCENPCQPDIPPPSPPPPEIISPPPPPPPTPTPKDPECPPPPAQPSTCSDGCAPPTIIQPPQSSGVYMPPGVNPYFPYTPYRTPPKYDSAATTYRSRFTSLLLCFCTALCFF